MPKTKNDHCLNMFVTYELKRALQQASDRCDCSLAEVVRFLLKLGLPILRGICESREMLLTQGQLFNTLRESPDVPMMKRETST